MSTSSTRTALIVGASRGLGQALAAEYLQRGWNVIGTVRGTSTPLHRLQAEAGAALRIEPLDTTDDAGIAALRRRLDGQSLGLLFVNAGILSDAEHSVAEIDPENFLRLMRINALAPIRVLEAFQDLVPADGVIGVMSSGLGSHQKNPDGAWDAYSASKAALNMLMAGFAARHGGGTRAVVIMAPGWVRTDMGGPAAPLGVEDSIPGVAGTLLAQAGRPGLRYLDYQGRAIGW